MLDDVHAGIKDGGFGLGTRFDRAKFPADVRVEGPARETFIVRGPLFAVVRAKCIDPSVDQLLTDGTATRNLPKSPIEVRDSVGPSRCARGTNSSG
jgi:hypothetical protein